MGLIAYKCLECGHYTISKYDGRRCVKCNGHLVPYGKATFADKSISTSTEKRNGNMKLVLKKDDNTEVEVKEIQSIDKDCKTIIFFINVKIRLENLKKIEEYISKKLGKEVLILPNFFENKIYSLM
ncbi:MAG: hypothetical protein E6X14_08070 [Clostridium celatum]|jgi:DNA-directed RNA polymerase subunit RPC12/RpoP|uniref:hypothetical protein n=1 Tax=uncultured Clostridium sp. TaxID=59620 RepID=UPI00082305B3|nr:hypothetical protein [uncultured Clostridium sp.]MDU4979393.1 hypothetical protein [Clostridium celatum]SCJ83342.1 Uncharacterised protein [uncultured Clostridium sp.]